MLRQEGWWTWHPLQFTPFPSLSPPWPCQPQGEAPGAALLCPQPAPLCLPVSLWLPAGSTSPLRTRCGSGRGGSASWGLELPPCSSPSPSWATPSASQVRGWGWGCFHPVHLCSWGCGSKGGASRVGIGIPTRISPLWLSICYCCALAAVGGGRMSGCVFPRKSAGSQRYIVMRVSEAHQLKDGSHQKASDPDFGKTVKDLPR